MEVIETKVYQFDELDESAKEKAREWYRSGGEMFFPDLITDDFVEIAKTLGIQLKQTGIPAEPCIYWSGFYQQGDGASFEGMYKYNAGSVGRVIDYAPKDTELHRIARELQEIQKGNFYQVIATIEQSGYYHHSGTMTVRVERNDFKGLTKGTESAIGQLMRDLADWFFASLRKEYEWQMEDEQIDETIRVNEYNFTKDGKIFP